MSDWGADLLNSSSRPVCGQSGFGSPCAPHGCDILSRGAVDIDVDPRPTTSAMNACNQTPALCRLPSGPLSWDYWAGIPTAHPSRGSQLASPQGGRFRPPGFDPPTRRETERIRRRSGTTRGSKMGGRADGVRNRRVLVRWMVSAILLSGGDQENRTQEPPSHPRLIRP
jgi:hypothetical protein